MGMGMKNSDAQNRSVGLALKGSTMGYGGDVVFQFHERMSARLGYDQLNVNRQFSFEESDVSYGANIDFKTGSITALYDFYLLKSLFVSAGVGLNNFSGIATGAANKDLIWGDITIPKEKIGDFEFDVKPGMRISPYLGIGFGRTLGKSHNIACNFELGTYYQGSPDIAISTTGLLSPTSNPEHGQEALIESQLSQYYLYPVMKLSLSYKLHSFSKKTDLVNLKKSRENLSLTQN